MNMVGVGVGILLFDEYGRILLILRNSDRKLADSDMRLEGTYTLPSGKLLYGESFEDACCRKLQDEVGLIVKKENLKMISISTDINRYAHFVTIGMFALKYSGQVVLKDSGEFVSYDWFDIDNLPSNLCEPSMKIINNYLSKKIYND